MSGQSDHRRRRRGGAARRCASRHRRAGQSVIGGRVPGTRPPLQQNAHAGRCRRLPGSPRNFRASGPSACSRRAGTPFEAGVHEDPIWLLKREEDDLRHSEASSTCACRFATGERHSATRLRITRFARVRQARSATARLAEQASAPAASSLPSLDDEEHRRRLRQTPVSARESESRSRCRGNLRVGTPAAA